VNRADDMVFEHIKEQDSGAPGRRLARPAQRNCHLGVSESPRFVERKHLRISDVNRCHEPPYSPRDVVQPFASGEAKGCVMKAAGLWKGRTSKNGRGLEQGAESCLVEDEDENEDA
jgi:hypothetical protein